MKSIFSVFLPMLLFTPLYAQHATESLKAGDVVNRMKENLTCSWATETVDTYKSGGPDTEVTGIACTFMASVEVIEKAAEDK